MKKTCLALSLALGMAGTAGGAQAHDSIGFSLSIGSPYYYEPAPVYVVPPPVYYAPPPTVYYGPAPRYYAPRIGYRYYDDHPRHGWHKHRGHHHGWRKHDDDDDD